MKTAPDAFGPSMEAKSCALASDLLPSRRYSGHRPRLA